jgi:hypothetical protein
VSEHRRCDVSALNAGAAANDLERDWRVVYNDEKPKDVGLRESGLSRSWISGPRFDGDLDCARTAQQLKEG